MTTEKAIQLLHRLQDEQFDGIHGDERREALDMAVRALEGDGDTISRKMAIDAMRKLQKWNIMREDYKNVGFSYDDVMFTLEKLTSAQPEITEDDVKEYCRKRCLIVVSSDLYDEMTRRWASEQPETHDKRTETHACDLINRQQAIDAVRKAKFSFRIESDIYFKICRGAMDEILNKIIDAHVKALEDLPPAERARFWIDSEGKISALPSGQIATDTNVGDMISRQQAIEGLYDVFFDDELKAAYPDKADVVLDVIRKLPTVQPEVLDCGSGELVKDSQRLVEASSNDLISRQQAIEAFEPEHHTDWYTPTIIKTLEELPQAQQDKSCKGCHFEKHGSRACDHCSRMYMDRYEVRNDG